MTSPIVARAYPRKHFFVEMFTRDISLVDCILDLVDNAIDGLIRSQKIDLGASLLSQNDNQPPSSAIPSIISITYSDKEFTIEDNCGGLGLNEAETEAFNFGHSQDYHQEIENHQLGVYGVGLKRAIFKIGRHFKMVSRTLNDGFETMVDLDEWVKMDKKLEDWTFPLRELSSANKSSQAGTKITIKGLRGEVRTAISDPTFESRLNKSIAQTYALFLKRHVRIRLGDHDIEPTPIPFGASDEVKPSRAKLTEDGVTVLLVASITSLTANSQWTQNQAGWYVACNGRLIVTADKTELTGWGTGALPAFHSKYRGFVGLALFQSNDPLKLPWKTTKRGLNEESVVYQRARNQMNATARPIISFLNKMYPKDPVPESWARQIASDVAQVDVRMLAQKPDSTFSVNPKKKRQARTSVKIQFDADRADIEKIKKHIRRPDLSAGQVGKYVLDEYMKSEGLS